MSVEQNLTTCCIGKFDGSLCHLSTYSRKKGFIDFCSELSNEEQSLIVRRTYNLIKNISLICFHHKSLLLVKYTHLQRHCLNPFGMANRCSVKGLRCIDQETADCLSNLTNKVICPGQKLCPNCRKAYSTTSSSCEKIDDIDDIDDIFCSTDTINTSLSELGISPLRKRVSKRDHASYVKSKISKVQITVAEKIAVVSGLSPDNSVLPLSSASLECENCIDWSDLILELQDKISTISNPREKVQVLTLIPNSWSRIKICSEFKVSDRMAKAAKKLKAKSGILTLPERNAAKKLPEHVKEKILKFYEHEAFSRTCPGKKDFVSERIGAKKVRMQKKLLLVNVKELFLEYKKENGAEVGFSKFCELRPKWCITVRSSGTHRICVCSIHQNIKLMLASSPVTVDYKCLIEKIVCDIESKECMLHRCDKCPGNEMLKAYLEEQFKDFESDETITFKQWIKVDRETLESLQLPVDDFIDDLISKVSILSKHHFIAKNQNNYLRLLKNELKSNELIILMDFSENYSFVVQDAVQGFYWENSQTTLHPFVVYYKLNGILKNKCYCVISNCMHHDTISVNAFLSKLLTELKTFLSFELIHYFSDGSAAQYKNFKNFMNLCHHYTDYGIRAEWNFIATSHGKSPCDGIGGTVKRLAARASLQRPIDNQILTPLNLYDFCKESITGISFIYVDSDEVDNIKDNQEKRFSTGNTVAGTRDNHKFVPVNENQVCVSRISNDNTSFIANVNESYNNNSTKLVSLSDLSPGNFVACIYDAHWWIGHVCEISEEQEDVFIDFLHPHGMAQSFYWPSTKDNCWVPEQHVIAVIPNPISSATGRYYNLLSIVVSDINSKFEAILNM